MNTFSRAFLALFFTYLCAHIAQSQPYDAIFVGMGTASSISMAKIVAAFPQKSFLVLEMGGPTAKSVGGTNVPSYFQSQPAAAQQTIFDVPGEYQNIAFQPEGEPYKIPQTFTWQGMGYGGNSQFNGMLFMSPPQFYLDTLPSPWKSSNMSAVFSDLRSRMTVTKSPSKDGQNYLNGITEVLATGFNGVGYSRSDTSDLTPLQNLEGYYNEPYVVTDGNGGRGGPISAYLTSVINPDGTSKFANLQIVDSATVSKIVFDTTDQTLATGVSYTVTGGTEQTATLKTGGKVILGAGALMSPRLLYMSGVGPTGKEAQAFDANPVTFARNNQKVGTVFDHVGIQIVLQYDGTSPIQTFAYGDISGNQEELNAYVGGRTGPYCQYGPVLTAHFKASAASAHPDVELFVNPNGPGDAQYNNGKSFQAVFMLLDPSSNDLLSLDSTGDIKFPGIYLSTDADKDKMANAIHTFLNDVVPKIPGLSVTKGPADPTSVDSIKAYMSDVGTFIMNHFTGTVPLVEGTEESAGGADPNTLRVRGTSNVHIVDASLLPNSVPAHPVAMVMALGSKAGDILVELLTDAAVLTSGADSNAVFTSDSDSVFTSDSVVIPGTSTSGNLPKISETSSTSADVNPTLDTVNRQQQQTANSAAGLSFSMISVVLASFVIVFA